MPESSTQPSPLSDLEKRREAPTRHMEVIVSNLLRGGVILSVIIMIAGMATTFHNHPDYFTTVRYQSLTDYPPDGHMNFPSTLGQAFSWAFHGYGRGIVIVGLLVLVLTPVMRVAVSILVFFSQRDRKYVLITCTVLILLLLSFVLGKVE